MQTKKLIILGGIMLLVAILFFASSEDEDAQLIGDLTRKQQTLEPLVSNPDIFGEYQPEMYNLTGNLIAARGPATGSWIVSDKENSASVEIPFPPTIEGSFPETTAGRDMVHRNAIATDGQRSQTKNPGFVGSSSCAECHAEKHGGFIETAHHRTSSLATPGSLPGPFEHPKNILRTRNRNLSFTMSQRDDGYVQSVQLVDWSLEFPMDVVTGSAKMGQTYLYWHGDALYQAHVSYISGPGEWITSPGFGDSQVHYARPIRLACLECHVTYIEKRRGENIYHRDSAIWGISCERCHGPGKQHIDFHREHPDTTVAGHIVNPEQLSRQRQLDICGQCHSGSFALRRGAFAFRPGQDLREYHRTLHPDFKGVGGVHTSNQLTRLRMSKCFQETEMTCTTCHNPHQNQRGHSEIFTESCIGCHEPTHCAMSEQLGARISEDCISCHMPLSANEGMDIATTSGMFTVSMADHYIRIDKQATESYLQEQEPNANAKR